MQSKLIITNADVAQRLYNLRHLGGSLFAHIPGMIL
jgi:hypothetical protein